MILDINGKELEFSTTLGVTVKIKQKFKKPYTQLLSELDRLDPEEMINLLYCGIKPDQMTETEFKAFMYDNCGMGDLTDAVTWFIKQIQYPGLSEEEIEKKLMEKRAQAALLDRN